MIMIFLYQEEVIPNREKTLTSNPFKEADLLNASAIILIAMMKVLV